MLANPQRQVWFIPQRHVLAHRLVDSDEFFLPKASVAPVVPETAPSGQNR
jgi:hypothetical protein